MTEHFNCHDEATNPSFTIFSRSDDGNRRIVDTTIVEHNTANIPLGFLKNNIIGFMPRGMWDYQDPVGACRTLMKFPGLLNGEIFESSNVNQIKNISLWLYIGGGYPSDNYIVEVYDYTGSAWDENTELYSPSVWCGCGELIVSKILEGNDDHQWVEFDITSVKRLWKSNSETVEKGIMIKTANDAGSALYISAAKDNENPPHITIDFDSHGCHVADA